jgi:hypothetical protein
VARVCEDGFVVELEFNNHCSGTAPDGAHLAIYHWHVNIKEDRIVDTLLWRV